jgi:hypothetical protein
LATGDVEAASGDEVLGPLHPIRGVRAKIKRRDLFMR